MSTAAPMNTASFQRSRPWRTLTVSSSLAIQAPPGEGTPNLEIPRRDLTVTNTPEKVIGATCVLDENPRHVAREACVSHIASSLHIASISLLMRCATAAIG